MPANTILSTPIAPPRTAIWRKQGDSAGWYRALQALLMIIGAGGCFAAFAFSVTEWTAPAVAAAILFTISAVWISGGAATALIGALLPPTSPREAPPDWSPRTRTALLFTVCGEDPRPLARHLETLAGDLRHSGLGDATTIFVLSDTSGERAITAEEAELQDLILSGAVTYRRRPKNVGRKPGNIADWFRAHGQTYEAMFVLDADSRMTAQRIRTLIWSMEVNPRLGLLQAGIALVPGRTAFGRHLRLSARLLSPTFLKGFAATTGTTANYWGHNALIRVAAFREALDLPVLSGQAPMGGPILSHDFVEAAWIRRAGWDVEVDASLSGSSEDAPQTLEDFSKRDRRWCQGNLQHTRLMTETGLHSVSRAHFLFGILSYLSAPIWLALLVLLTSGLVTLNSAWPLLPVLLLLLAPKLCALVSAWSRVRTAGRRLTLVRAFATELVTSTMLAPIIMIRQTGAVIAVLAGRDCGWKKPDRVGLAVPQGAAEVFVAAALLTLSVASQTSAMLWLLPVVMPLAFAPLIIHRLDQRA